MDGFDDDDDEDHSARSRLEALRDGAPDDLDDDGDYDAGEDGYAHQEGYDGLDDGPPAAPGEVDPVDAPFIEVGEPLTAEHVDAVFDIMSDFDRDGAEELRAEWGSAAADNLRFAVAATRSLASPELLDEFTRTGMGDSPELMRVAARVGRLLAKEPGDPSTINLRNNPMPTASPATQDRLDELADLQLTNPSKYKSKKVQTELQSLYERVYGTEPVIGGPEGRVL